MMDYSKLSSTELIKHSQLRENSTEIETALTNKLAEVKLRESVLKNRKYNTITSVIEKLEKEIED